MQRDPVICPKCGSRAQEQTTRYGRRSACCDLWSWDGKPLVSAEVHKARQHCHDVVDAIWKRAETAYTVKEPLGSYGYDQAVKRIRKSMRNRVYRWLSAKTGLPEPECHMAAQTDLEKLRAIYRAARGATPQIVRDWAREQQAIQIDALLEKAGSDAAEGVGRT